MRMTVANWRRVQSLIPDDSDLYALIEDRVQYRTGEHADGDAAITLPREDLPTVLKIMSDNDIEQLITEWVTDPDGELRMVFRTVVPRVP